MTKQDGDPNAFLQPQPGQGALDKRKFHPLPGTWAKDQIEGRHTTSTRTQKRAKPLTELQQALAAEKRRIDESMRQQGIIPGKAIYENPTQNQNVLLPTIKYASG
ncbi:hypothetical protein KC887_08040 [Candidatus Kaiserbacteria bacterium]|nr:hypothetical protein [Candidatus Kaiserbacteria bacterium]